MPRQVILKHEGKDHDLGRVYVPIDGDSAIAVRAADAVSHCFYRLKANVSNQERFFLVVEAVAKVFSGRPCCRDRELEDRIIRIFMSVYHDEYERMMGVNFESN